LPITTVIRQQPARPSQEDIRLAYDPDISYVIVSLAAEFARCKIISYPERRSEKEEIRVI
jgi:proteasome lid subunit RPN8/RPN11